MWKNNNMERAIRLFQSGTILTKSKTGSTDKEKECEECGVKEDMEHLLVKCKIFREIRLKWGVDEHDSISELLQLGIKDERKGGYLEELYMKRFIH